MSKRLKTLRARAKAAERDLGQAEKDLEAAEAALEDQMKETVLLRRERDDSRKLQTAEREAGQVLGGDGGPREGQVGSDTEVA